MARATLCHTLATPLNLVTAIVTLRLHPGENFLEVEPFSSFVNAPGGGSILNLGEEILPGACIL